MANIGTTIAPWMLFFQQSSVVDKGLKEKDIPWGKFDTLIGSVFTVVVAVFIVIVTGTVLNGQDIDDAAQAAIDADGDPPATLGAVHGDRPVRRRPARRDLHLARQLLGVRRSLRLGALAQQQDQGSAAGSTSTTSSP